jgi:tetratricopeptide (TPR) repeat protein
MIFKPKFIFYQIILIPLFHLAFSESYASDLMSLEKKLEKNPSHLITRRKLAKAYYDGKQFDKVIKTLDPFSSDLKADGLNLLAESFKLKTDYKNESRILLLALKLEPENYKFHINLAKSYTNQELYDEATETFRKAIQLQPQTESSYLGLLFMFKKRENNYESQIIVNDLIKRFGRKALYLNELCRIFTEEAYLDQAIAACKEASEKSPRVDDNIANLAQSYLDSESNEEAEKTLKNGTAKFAKSLRLHLMTSNFYFTQNNYSVANRYFQMAAKIDGKSHEAQLGLARTSFLLKNFKDSLSAYEKACALDSKETLRYFKEATTKLRLDKVHDWESRFNSALFRCNK